MAYSSRLWIAFNSNRASQYTAPDMQCVQKTFAGKAHFVHTCLQCLYIYYLLL